MTKKGTKQAPTSTRASSPADKAIGLKIRQARNDAEMSQEDLGNELGVSFQQVQKYEKGVNRVTAPRLVDLARIVGKPIDFFITEAKYKPNSRGEKIAQIVASREGHAILEALADMTPDMRSHMVGVARTLAKTTAEAA